jgi:uncharacterized RDD family membrane protein YckC
MQPCACDLAHEDSSGSCPITVSKLSIMSEPGLQSSFDQTTSDRAGKAIENQEDSDSSDEAKAASTLIEFPGVSRAIPEWRKQLSQRVREVQERRAREAAQAAAVQASTETVACALPSAQLELVPDREQPAMKPIVSKALERLERARQISADSDFVTAESEIAAIVDELLESHAAAVKESDEPESRKSKLVVVPPPAPLEVSAQTPLTDSARKPVRAITDGVEDQALSYYESCLSVPVVDFYPTRKQAGAFPRFIGGVLDLLVIGLITTLCALAIQQLGGDWKDPRVIELTFGLVILLMFLYFTLTIALTGRTVGMRMLSLRTIDKHTGLIPTGGQAIKRAVGYEFSLILCGLGFLYALIDRDRCTVHDRLSQTIVIQD